MSHTVRLHFWETFLILKKFECVSGLRVNVDKSEGLWLGSLCHSSEQPFGIRWPKTPILALGVFFTYNENDLTQCNFNNLLKDINVSLISWNRHNISIYGRILVIKTFVISKLLYRASVLPVPFTFIKAVNDMIYSFTWRYKKPLVKKISYNW